MTAHSLPGAAKLWQEQAEHGKLVAAWDNTGWWNVDQAAKRGLALIVPTATSVLDLGCGIGRWIDHLHPLVYTGVDWSALMLVEAHRRHPDRLFCQEDVTQFTPERAYDVALLIAIINHLEKPDEAFYYILDHIDLWVEFVVVSYYTHETVNRYEDFGTELGIVSRSVVVGAIDDVAELFNRQLVWREDIYDYAHAGKALRIRVDIWRRGDKWQELNWATPCTGHSTTTPT